MVDSAMKRSIINLLNSEPVLDEKANQKPLENWRIAGPLRLEEIIANSDVPICLNANELTYVYNQEETTNFSGLQFKYSGQINKDDVYEGIGRRIFEDGDIVEGQCINGKINGYGRTFDISGGYYVGTYRDGQSHGYGKYVHPDGVTVEEGLWMDD